MNTQHFGLNELLVKSTFNFAPDQLSVLERALELAQEQLKSFAKDSVFAAKMALAFGSGSNTTALQTAWLAGDFSVLSGIELLGTDTLNGANGAYAKSTNRIYLSSAFLNSHLNDPMALASVLLEEAGHRIDAQTNEMDSPGDEGAIFSALVQGKTLDADALQALKAEDDHATITLNGQLIQVELSGTNDNTLGTAISVGVLSGTQNFTDFVGSTDTVDYYRFSLTGTSDFALQLSGTSQSNVNAFVYYDANNNGLVDAGEFLYSTAVSAGGIAKINATLGASGNYYVGIAPSAGTVNSNYSLQLAATSAPPSITPDPGNTLGTAYNIGALTGTQTFKEFVGSTDPVDYYKFSLTGASNITLQLSGTSQSNVNAFIYYDANNNGLIDAGEQRYSTAVGAGGTAQINATLGSAGNYYVGISPSSGTVNSNYSLQLANLTTPAPAPLAPLTSTLAASNSGTADFSTPMNDSLIGVQTPLVNPSGGEIDILTGNKETNAYILGNKDNPSYVGPSLQDYAPIKDLGAEDSIQLYSSSSDYVLGTSPVNATKGTETFLTSDPNDLLGIIQGDAIANLSLSSTSFHHV